MKQPTPVNPYVGQRIRLERKRLGISQEALASELDISVNYLGQLERGSRPVNFKIAEKICSYFGLTLDYLYRGMTPDAVCEQASPDSDPRREIMELCEVCTDQELRLCLELFKPLLAAWRSAIKKLKSQSAPPSKTWFNQKC